MPDTPRFSTLWAVNGALDAIELRAQLDDFVAAGLDGVVFHPRFYPGRPPYLDDEYLAIVSRLVLDAHDRGLEFWIYDENGWPSGTVGGLMLERHPGLRQQWLELQPDAGQPALHRFTHDEREWALVVRHGEGVDYLAPDLADRFIDLCYRRYADGLAPEAMARVAGFFSDEPEFGLGHAQHELSAHGAVPWTPDLPEQYAGRHGRDLIADLPSLFGDGADAETVRTDFWELVTDLFADRYLARLDTWCRERGLRFTAHVKGEEHPLFQLPTVGSLGTISRAIGMPGIDALGRHPVNDFYPRQASSVARQFSDGRAMAEAFGGAGWGAGPADLERYLGWLGGHGITDFVLHLSQYRLDSAAIEDWPPSHPRHVSWSGAYREVLDAVRARLAAAPRPPADLLVVVPQRGLARRYEPWEFVATNVHDAHDFPATPAGEVNAAFLRLVERLSAAGEAYEFADERTVEQWARADDGCLALGASRYRRVIVAPGAAIDDAASALIAPFLADEPLPEDPARPERGAFEPAPALTLHAGVDRRPLSWRLASTPRNELVLEPVRAHDGVWEAEIESSTFDGPFELRFADEPRELHWNGARVGTVSRGEYGHGVRVRLAAGRVGRLRFRADGVPPGTVPRAWAVGGFRVAASVRETRGALLALDGGFRLARPRREVSGELAADGLPFAFEPVEVVTEVDVPVGASALRFAGGLADAAWISVGGEPGVWRWGEGGWEVPVGRTGLVEVGMRLVPSSFNRYGPHHHYLGDPVVVSPAQMRGIRNYADLDDAPEATHVPYWWVRRAVLPAEAEVIGVPVTHAGAIHDGASDVRIDNGRDALIK
ncbi:hypothetical protein ABIQ69_02725 [Agromyces sp. G08B096]|uniref:Glycoside hydrolase n=1 Tax=Agromyces sp. G08B096 TaxID=3156399 RepID=A0AAU7W958_9MICO